ncbi:MAG: hypothetical protein QNL04_12270 [SAR324 cluster bacterium]|nr:hypothetical protein [SAR324 cluster bacterium]
MKNLIVLCVLLTLFFPSLVFAISDVNGDIVDKVARAKLLKIMREVTLEKIDDSLDDKPIHIQLYFSDMVKAATEPTNLHINNHLLTDISFLLVFNKIFQTVDAGLLTGAKYPCNKDEKEQSKADLLICKLSEADQISFYTYRALVTAQPEIEKKNLFPFYEELVKMAEKRHWFSLVDEEDRIAILAELKLKEIPTLIYDKVINTVKVIEKFVGLVYLLESSTEDRQKALLKYLYNNRPIMALSDAVDQNTMKVVLKAFQDYVDFVQISNQTSGSATFYTPTTEETKKYFTAKLPEILDEFQSNEWGKLFVSVANSQGIGWNSNFDEEGAKIGSTERGRVALYHEKIGYKLKRHLRSWQGKSEWSTNFYLGGILYNLTPNASSSFQEEIKNSSLLGIDFLSWNWRKTVEINLFAQRVYINTENINPVASATPNGASSQIDMYGLSVSIPLGDYLGAL